MPTIAVDFDGVVHAYSRGWHDGTLYAPPVEGAFGSLRHLMEHHAVYLHTSRQPLVDIGKWLDRHESGFAWVTDGDQPSWSGPSPDQNTPPEWDGQFWQRQDLLLISNRKLPAVAYIDDRGVRFLNWRQTIDVLWRHGHLPEYRPVDDLG